MEIKNKHLNILKNKRSITMAAKLYMRSDGNGGLNISKPLIALVTLIVLLLSTTCVLAAKGSKLNTEVFQMQEDIGEMKTEIGEFNNFKLDTSVDLATIINKLDNIEKKLEVK